ncbi:hypothetical protein ES703_97929 [subsurface metagenome]
MAVSYRRERIDRGIKARCDDIFALSSYREVLYLVLPRVLPVTALLILPMVLEIYWTKVIVLSCTIALLTLSWDLIYSTGMISIGQAWFFGVGGYIAGALNYYFGLSPLFTIPIATIGGAIFCTLLLAPVLRLRGIYFAMITFALGLVFMRIIEATGILGGTVGLSGLSPLPNLWVEVYVIIAAVLLGLFVFRRVINTDYGLVLRGIGQNDRAVMSGGINIYRYKAQSLFIGSAVAAFAGAFTTHYIQYVGLPAFAMDYSILPIASVVVGGAGTFAGGVLGAFILVPLSEMLRGFATLRIVFYCLILVGFIVFKPEGLMNYFQRKYHQFERWIEV